MEINYTETFRDTYKYHAICMFQFRQVLLCGKSYSFYVSRFSYYSFAGSTGYIPFGHMTANVLNISTLIAMCGHMI